MNWIQKYNKTVSFKESDNISEEEKELKNKKSSAIKNGKWYFKANSADNGTKIEVILKNRKKYHISAMCKILKISRSLI